MVRALLADTKTQTRRIAKLLLPGDKNYIFAGSIEEWISKRAAQCPYGQAGDRLWVRETCQAWEYESGGDAVRYVADGAFKNIEATQDAMERWLDLNNYAGKKHVIVPSIHMPRWASRIALEITGVRVERLHDISEKDAIAEGAYQDAGMNGMWTYDGDTYTSGRDGAKRAYSLLWESINGPGSWNANPWVWVIEFKRVLT
jgi:hypothetical protein